MSTPRTVLGGSQRPHRSVALAVAGLVSASLLVGSVGVSASNRLSGTGVATTAQQSQPADGVIPLAPLTDLTSLDATVTLTVDGTADGDRPRAT